MSHIREPDLMDVNAVRKSPSEESAESREKADESMQRGMYGEAVIHYTNALDNCPQTDKYIILSNRSQALLKAEQYHLALQDAEKTIELAPTSHLGYLRKGEIQFQCGVYGEAIKSYNQARVRNATDKVIAECVKKTNRQLNRVNKEAARRPWLFIGCSILIGICLLAGNHFVFDFRLLSHMIIRVLFLGMCGGAGYAVARIYQYYLDNQKKALLDEPLDLLRASYPEKSDANDDQNTIGQSSHKTNRPSSSHRHRHRRGR